MKTKTVSTLIALLLIVAVFFPASATPPQEFADLEHQAPDALNWPEHYVVWQEYLYAAFSTPSRSFTYWAEQDVRTFAQDAVAHWNQNIPTDVEAPTYVTNENDAQIIVQNDDCETGTTGCFVVTAWGVNSGFNIRWVYEGIVGLAYNNGTLQGHYWTNFSATSVMVHEWGHAWGLGDQYTPSGCNPNSTSVMDSSTVNSSNQIVPCDNTDYPTIPDLNRWYWYFNGGSYANPNTYVSGSEVRSEWKDEAWMDWDADFFWYYYDYPQGAAHLFYGNAVVRDNGSHRFVGAASSRIIWDKVNPGNYGVHNKYIQACTRPFFSNYPIYGTWNCSSLVWYN